MAGIALAGLGIRVGLIGAIGIVAALAVATTIQRIWHVRRLADRPSVAPAAGDTQRRMDHRGKHATARARATGIAPRDGKIRVAIVGVGNCASCLVQGRYYYADAEDDDFVPGLMHVNLGGYHIRDIEFVAAFDVDNDKVGKDLSEAIFAGQNNTYKFADVPHTRRHRRARHDPRRAGQVPLAR